MKKTQIETDSRETALCGANAGFPAVGEAIDGGFECWEFSAVDRTSLRTAVEQNHNGAFV